MTDTSDLDAPGPVTDPTDLDLDEPDDPDGSGRRLFAYLGGEEWREHRSVLSVFAGTFFSEFTPDEVAERLAERGVDLDPQVVTARLESLRRWGNLAVSSSVGSPASLADYYRRRSRYLITRAGQEVHDLVEGVLGRVDEVRDVSAGRLRTLLDALRAVRATDLDVVDPTRLADLVRDVFDPHEAFTAEITQFFAALNQWQSRYDLTEAELAFFAQVLVTYVAERLDEIERTARPVGLLLDELTPHVPTIVARVERGLARRVEQAGLADDVTVSRSIGTAADDWVHLRSWFLPHSGRPARLAQLGDDAVAAVRTLTVNLTRLSRVGLGSTSRRHDLVTLATIFDRADPDDLPALAHAAFGLSGSVHHGELAGDADDPVPSTTPWRAAPAAVVPVAVRERGERRHRGASTPLRDRTTEVAALRRRRTEQADANRRIDAELIDTVLDGSTVSVAALHRLQGLVGATLARVGPSAGSGEHADGDLVCAVQRVPGRSVTVMTEEGSLRLDDLDVTVRWVGSGGVARDG